MEPFFSSDIPRIFIPKQTMVSYILRWMMLFTLVMPVGLTAVAAQQVADESWRLASLGSLVAAGTKVWGTPKSWNKMDDQFSIEAYFSTHGDLGCTISSAISENISGTPLRCTKIGRDWLRVYVLAISLLVEFRQPTRVHMVPHIRMTRALGT